VTVSPHLTGKAVVMGSLGRALSVLMLAVPAVAAYAVPSGAAGSPPLLAQAAAVDPFDAELARAIEAAHRAAEDARSAARAAEDAANTASRAAGEAAAARERAERAKRGSRDKPPS
jgi:hypothetical protein